MRYYLFNGFMTQDTSAVCSSCLRLKAMNLPFCLWLYAFGRTNRRVTVMFHEATVPSVDGQPMRHRLLAVVTRLMAMLAVRSASTIFVSTPAWKDRLTEFAGGKTIGWLPVPSNVAVANDPAAIAAMRQSMNGPTVVGHFGTYNAAISQLLIAPLLQLLVLVQQTEPVPSCLTPCRM